jgi:deoxyribonuclease-1
MVIKLTTLFTSVFISALVLAEDGNTSIQSFSKAKKLLQKEVYHDHQQTIYCNAVFDDKKKITLPAGYHSTKHKKRAKKVEWEHVVPAENFGRTFAEWRDGDPKCVKKNGKTFKGRSCANKINMEYRYMQADLYNLFPAIGAVNAMRSNYNFTMLPGEETDFGTCSMKIANKKAEPPIEARGRIARAYLYMEQTYSRYKMSKAQRNLMNAWDKKHPVSDWECKRAERIEKLQGNVNSITASRC